MKHICLCVYALLRYISVSIYVRVYVFIKAGMILIQIYIDTILCLLSIGSWTEVDLTCSELRIQFEHIITLFSQIQRNIWSGSILHILQLQIVYVHPVSSTYRFSWFNHNLTHSLVTPYKSLKPLCLCSYTAVKSALQLITQDFFVLTLKELVNPCQKVI